MSPSPDTPGVPPAEKSGVARSTTHKAAALIHLVGSEALQELQNRFTELGQVTVCIRAVDGEPITRPSWGSRYSELIGTSPTGSAEFTEAIRECVRGGSPSVPPVENRCHTGQSHKAPGDIAPVLCHDGMTLYATGIVPENEKLAVIVVGTRSATPPPPNTVRAIAEKYDVEADELLSTARLVDPYNGGAPQAIHRFADVLADTIATLYRQAARIERQLADLNVVHQLTELLSGSQDLQEILDLTVKRVVEVMNVKACGIRLLNDQTGELVIKAVHNLSDEYLQKGPVTLQDNAIDTAAFAGQVVCIEDVATDPRIRYPQNAVREGIVSGLCVPMAYRGRTVGVLRVYTARRYSFNESEQALLRSIGSQTASAIINAQLREEQIASDRFQRQVDAAGEIQRRMLPHRSPQVRGLHFGCVYEPTLQVGGDFYDFIELSNGGLGVCIADVVGKGLPAALLMASVRSALRTSAKSGLVLEEILAEVNRHMWRDTLVGEFTTLFYGTFSANGRRLTYCNAGHPAPVVLRGGDFIELMAGGLVIGVQPQAEYEHETLVLQPDDVLVMMTDGVTEAMSFDDTAYGRDRLLASIRKHRSLDAQQLAQQILWDVRRFVGLAHQSDDITIVVVKVS